MGSSYLVRENFLRGLICLGVLVLLLSGHPGRADIAKGEPAPEWVLNSIEGDLVRFPQVTRGNPAIVIFWASWCPYCKALLPELSEVKATFESAGLEIYAINFAEAEGFKLDRKMRTFPFRHFLKGEDVAEQYNAEMLPAFFIVADNRIEYIRDYPGKDHPSQQVKSHSKQAPLLAAWWKQRLISNLEEIYQHRADRLRDN